MKAEKRIDIYVLCSNTALHEQLKDQTKEYCKNFFAFSSEEIATSVLKSSSKGLLIFSQEFSSFANLKRESFLTLCLLDLEQIQTSTLAINDLFDAYICLPFAQEVLDKNITNIIENKQVIKNIHIYKQKLKEFDKIINDSFIIAKGSTLGKITYVNKKFCALTKYTREEIVGKPFSLLKSMHTPSALHKELWETITDGKVFKSRFNNIDKFGQDYIVDVIITPVFNKEDNSIKEFICFIQDVTSLVMHGRKLQKEKVGLQMKKLKDQKEHEEQISKLKDSYLLMFSHELKTPLNSIINFAQHVNSILEKQDFEKKERVLQEVDIIQENGLAMFDIIDNILTLSKIKSGVQECRYSTFDINEIMLETFDKFAATIRNEQIEVINDIQSSIEIVSDHEMLLSISSNLFSNAIKYGKGKVKVSAIALKNNFMISIEDNGQGIDCDKGIFELFEQGDSDFQTREGKGIGIGLNIVQSLCQKLDLSVTIAKSKELGGAKMTIQGKRNQDQSEYVI